MPFPHAKLKSTTASGAQRSGSHRRTHCPPKAVMQLWRLKWADANPRARETRTRELIALQRADGGWAQTPRLGSDAYATGQVLYTLRELGVSAADAALRHGVDFLVETQREDRSWYVP